MNDVSTVVVALSLLGLVAGLALLVRGLAAYRARQRVAGIGTSRITSLAAGEVRLAGVVEADVMTLVSPLQSVPCVYFRSRIREGSGDDTRTILDEERAVGFRLRDATGRSVSSRAGRAGTRPSGSTPPRTGMGTTLPA